MKTQNWLKRYASKMNRPLRDRLRRLERKDAVPECVPVIIQFKRQVTSARISAMNARLGVHRFPVTHRLPLVRSVCGSVSADCLKRMCGMDEIHKIYLDRQRRMSLSVATPSIGAAAVQRKRGLTGKGVRIAILDTGVYPHPDLVRPVNRIAAFKDFVNMRTRPYDDNGHGTHVAGDAAGNGWSSGGKFRGPAPEAEIVAVKVLDREGNGFDSTIIRAIQWCIANRKRLKLRILSLSLGGPAFTSCKDDPLCQAAEEAVRAGLTVVVSAGNAGPFPGTIESPGISPSAITVGAVDDRRTVNPSDDRVTWFSSRGPAFGGARKPDLAAPGESIISLRAPRSLLDREEPERRVGRRYFVLSGTSMSAPLVSGAAAQLLQQRPRLSPACVKKLLTRNAFRLKPGDPLAVGSGEVNVRFLLQPKCAARKRNNFSGPPKKQSGRTVTIHWYLKPAAIKSKQVSGSRTANAKSRR